MDVDRILIILTAVIGGLAIILGVFGFAKKEHLRVAGSATILGGTAIAFQFAAMALAAIVLAIFIAATIANRYRLKP